MAVASHWMARAVTLRAKPSFVDIDPQSLTQLTLHFCVYCGRRRRPRNHHDVLRRNDLVPVPPEELTHQAFHPVADDRATDAPTSGDSEPRNTVSPWLRQHHEARACPAPSTPLKLEEICALANA